MIYSISLLQQLNIVSDDELEVKLKNTLVFEFIDKVKRIKKDLVALNEPLDVGKDYPEWYIRSINFFTELFAQLLSKIKSNRFGSEPEKRELERSINVIYNFFYFHIADTTIHGTNTWHYPQPILESYLLNSRIDENKNHVQLLVKDYDDRIKKLKLDFDSDMEKKKMELTDVENQLKSSLALVNKEVGRIGVKRYADIFYRQALEHSLLICKKNDDYDPEQTKNKDQKFFWNVGKAQRWLVFAIILGGLLLWAFTKLDAWFPVNTPTFTPKTTVYVIGRFLFVSLIIFIISFAFKQFRVNMHLYTLNKHRANTLKSFEYLIRAPDNLAPESYNAILLEVAKAIYESGQTGYINSNDVNSDIPSIIDMSKVFTHPK